MTTVSGRGAALVLAVFVGGMAVGALGFRTFAHRRMDHAFEGREGQGMERMLLHAIDRRVDLDATQRDKVASILSESQHERRALMEPAEPALDALRKKTESRIRDALRPEQRPAFDAFAEHLAERHRRGFPPPPPPEFAAPRGPEGTPDP